MDQKIYFAAKALAAMDCCSREPMDVLYEDVNGAEVKDNETEAKEEGGEMP